MILLFAIGVLFVLKRMRIIMKIFAREVSQTYVRVAWVVRVVLVICEICQCVWFTWSKQSDY